jgi:hypothetical protein
VLGDTVMVDVKTPLGLSNGLASVVKERPGRFRASLGTILLDEGVGIIFQSVGAVSILSCSVFFCSRSCILGRRGPSS